MKPGNIEFLNQNRHHYTTLIQAFYLRSLSGETRQRMQDIMSEEFHPGYTTDLWCPPCVTDMVKRLYQAYDQWLAAQTVPQPEVKQPETKQVHANFPSHKKKHR